MKKILFLLLILISSSNATYIYAEIDKKINLAKDNCDFYEKENKQKCIDETMVYGYNLLMKKNKKIEIYRKIQNDICKKIAIDTEGCIKNSYKNTYKHFINKTD